MSMQNCTAVPATEQTATRLDWSRADQSTSLTAWLSTSKAVLGFWPRSQSGTCFSLGLLAFVFFPSCGVRGLLSHKGRGRRRGNGFQFHGATFAASYNIKGKIKLNYIYRPSPYRAVNTLRLCYTNQSVNAV